MKRTATLLIVLLAASVQAQSIKGYKKEESGLYSQFYKQNKQGTKPKIGDVVKLILSYSNSKDSVLFDSQKNNPNNTNFLEFSLTEPSFKGSFEEALAMMTEGDSASFLVNADSVYLKTFFAPEVPAFIEKGSMLNFQVRLLKVTSKEVAEKERLAILENLKNQEAKSIARYIDSAKVTVKPTASGLYYVEKKKGSGSKPVAGDIVKVNYTARFLNGSVFDTSDETIAKQSDIYEQGRVFEPIEFALGEGQMIAGWDEAIAMMRVGEKGQLVIPSSLAYGEVGNGPIPPYSPMVFDVELISFGSKEKFEAEEKAKLTALENEAISKYMNENKLAKVKPTPNGLIFIEKTKGTGAKPTIGNKVKVNYTGRLLDGTIFDTNNEALAKQAGIYNEAEAATIYKPFEYTLGAGQMVIGFEEGITLMSAGAKAQLIMPSLLAYGEYGTEHVPTLTPVVYEVELVSFTPAQ